MKKKTQIKRGSGIRPISKAPHRLVKRFVPASVLKEVKARSGGQCEVLKFTLDGMIFHRAFNSEFVFMIHPNMHWVSHRCPQMAQKQPHHLLKRSRGGKHEASNLCDCCFSCHNWIENNDKKAVKYGLSLPYANYKA